MKHKRKKRQFNFVFTGSSLVALAVFSRGMASLELLVIIITFLFAILMGWIAFGFLKDLKTSNS